nr:unnamed protein product [Callosobruchus chinensis]
MSLKITFNSWRFKAKLQHFFNMEASINQHLTDDYSEVYRSLPLKLQLAYGVGHVLNDVCASMWFTYLLVFFHLVLEFSNWQTGFMLLVGQIADALATPFVGYHSDQSDGFCFWRYGRRKIWHLLGVVCVLCTFPFIFAPCIGCENSGRSAQMFYYCMFIVIFQFGWAAVQISHLSLIPELTPNEHDRTKLTAIRYCFTVISNVLVYIITWIVLHMNDGETNKIGPSDGPKFQHVVWSVISLGIVCSVIFHVYVREWDNEVSQNVRGSQLRTSVRDLLLSCKVYQVAAVYMSSRLFVNLTQVFIPLYLHETLEMPASSLASVPLIMFVGSLVTSLFIEKINRCCGRKLTYTLGALLGIVACVWIRIGSEPELPVDWPHRLCVYSIGLLIGSGGSIVLVSSLGVTTDLIGEKTDSGAFVYGIMSFTDKIANGVAVVLIQYAHSDASDRFFYRDAISYVCGGSALLGTLAVLSLARRGPLGGYARVPDYNSINA